MATANESQGQSPGELLEQYISRYYNNIHIRFDEDVNWMIQEIMADTATPDELQWIVEQALLSTAEIEMGIIFRHTTDGSISAIVPVMSAQTLLKIKHLEIQFIMDYTTGHSKHYEFGQILMAAEGGIAALAPSFPHLQTLIMHLKVNDVGLSEKEIDEGLWLNTEYSKIIYGGDLGVQIQPMLLPSMNKALEAAYRDGPGVEKVFCLSLGEMRCYDIEIGELLKLLGD